MTREENISAVRGHRRPRPGHAPRLRQPGPAPAGMAKEGTHEVTLDASRALTPLSGARQPAGKSGQERTE